MAVEMIRYQQAMAFRRPGAPYVAWSRDFSADSVYRSDFVEIVLILGGEGKLGLFAADGAVRSRRLLPGHMLLLRPRDVRSFEGIGEHGMSATGVTFPFATWERFVITAEIDRSLFATPDPPIIEVDLDDPAAMRPFRRIQASPSDPGFALDLLEFLVAIIPRFVRSAPTAHGQKAPDWLWSAIERMNDESNLRIGAARFGELCHVSPSHLWRTTRRYFGLSPSELVLDIQLRHAAALLTSTEERIAVIGDRCGFPSPSSFSTAFRKAHLISPREYRTRSRTF